ncbi:MAG: OmpA family protein [Thermoanaerobaculia bacterium]
MKSSFSTPKPLRVAVAAAAAFLTSTAGVMAVAGSVPRGLSQGPPVICTGNQDVRLVRHYIAAEGDAVTAVGNCEVSLQDCVIEAAGVAVRASGNATVHIYNSRISGAGGALSASDLAEIRFRGSTLQGSIRAAGMAELVDLGGNTREEGEPSAPPGGSGTVKVGGIEVGSTGVRIGGADVVQIDEEGIRVGGGAVVVDEQGVRVGGEGAVVTEEGVRVGGEAVIVQDDGSTVAVVDTGEVVTIDPQGNVRVDSPGGTVVVSGDWRDRGTVYSDTEGVLIELGATSDRGGIRVDLAGDILFDFDSAAIRPSAAATLSKAAHVIRRRATGRVEVVGHTDSIGTQQYNLKLSQERAISVVRWLNQAEGIPLQLLTARGVGSSQPIDHNTMPDGSDNPPGRARNRRVELRIAAGG